MSDYILPLMLSFQEIILSWHFICTLSANMQNILLTSTKILITNWNRNRLQIIMPKHHSCLQIKHFVKVFYPTLPVTNVLFFWTDKKYWSCLTILKVFWPLMYPTIANFISFFFFFFFFFFLGGGKKWEYLILYPSSRMFWSLPMWLKIN